MSITAPAASGPITRPMPFVVVARPETAPRSSGGTSLKRSPQASVITVPPTIATTKIRREVPRVPCRAEAAGEQPDAVDGRRRRDHACETDPVADPARDECGHDVAPATAPRMYVEVTSGSPSPTVT